MKDEHVVWVRFTVPGETEAISESTLRKYLDHANLHWEDILDLEWYVYDRYDMGEALDHL